MNHTDTRLRWRTAVSMAQAVVSMTSDAGSQAAFPRVARAASLRTFALLGWLRFLCRQCKGNGI